LTQFAAICHNSPENAAIRAIGHDDISAIRRKKPQFAAKHPDSLQFAA